MSAIARIGAGALDRAVFGSAPEKSIDDMTIEELEAVIDGNPFVARGEDAKALHVTFMDEVPTSVALESVRGKRADADEFAVIGRHVYLFCPDGYGSTKLTNTFFEKKLGSPATTRNWKTVTTLVEMAQA